jgi:hypothetical protein
MGARYRRRQRAGESSAGRRVQEFPGLGRRDASVIITALAIDFVPPHETAELHSMGELRKLPLNQDCSTIYHNGLPRAKSFLHQE